MKRMLRPLVILALLLALTACSSGITEGTVIEKTYHEAYETVTNTPIMTSTGKVTTTTYMPIQQHHPESWEVVIQGYNSETEQEEKRSFRVAQDVFDHVEVNDFFEYGDTISISKPVQEQDSTAEEKSELSAE